MLNFVVFGIAIAIMIAVPPLGIAVLLLFLAVGWDERVETKVTDKLQYHKEEALAHNISIEEVQQRDKAIGLILIGCTLVIGIAFVAQEIK